MVKRLNKGNLVKLRFPWLTQQDPGYFFDILCTQREGGAFCIGTTHVSKPLCVHKESHNRVNKGIILRSAQETLEGSILLVSALCVQ